MSRRSGGWLKSMMIERRGKTARDLFLRDFPTSLAEDAASLFIGAGVSMAAGYPSWRELLQDIGDELGVSSADVSDLAALAQWHIRRNAGSTRIRQVIRDKIAPDRVVPEILEMVARLPFAASLDNELRPSNRTRICFNQATCRGDLVGEGPLTKAQTGSSAPL